jgi:ER-bound oxygenase mpaB/B'/Rubber oxygenase, catalytic domain
VAGGLAGGQPVGLGAGFDSLDLTKAFLPARVDPGHVTDIDAEPAEPGERWLLLIPESPHGPYAASDPHLLTWVHNTEADSFLRAHIRFGAEPLDQAGRDGLRR